MKALVVGDPNNDRPATSTTDTADDTIVQQYSSLSASVLEPLPLSLRLSHSARDTAVANVCLSLFLQTSLRRGSAS